MAIPRGSSYYRVFHFLGGTLTGELQNTSGCYIKMLPPVDPNIGLGTWQIDSHEDVSILIALDSPHAPKIRLRFGDYITGVFKKFYLWVEQDFDVLGGFDLLICDTPDGIKHSSDPHSIIPPKRFYCRRFTCALANTFYRANFSTDVKTPIIKNFLFQAQGDTIQIALDYPDPVVHYFTLAPGAMIGADNVLWRPPDISPPVLPPEMSNFIFWYRSPNSVDGVLETLFWI